jgi:glycosyltransferase involved in cell wall biosynthesis
MRILMASQMTPYLPCHDGFRVMVAHLVASMGPRHPLALVSAGDRTETPEQRRWAAPFCAWMETLPPARWVHPWTGTPAQGIQGMRTALSRAVDSFAPDVLHLEGGMLAPLAGLGGVPTVLALHDSRALRAREFRRLARTPWDHLGARLSEWQEAAWEGRWAGRADLRVVASEEDRLALSHLGPQARTEVLPLGVDVHHFEFRRGGQPDRIVFTGNLAWPPNIDAACRLAHAILPRIRRRRPRAELVVAGANPVPAVRALAALPGIRLTGTVPDIRPSLWSATVAVSPLRAGYGMKNKILEAMALGTPVVGSPRSLSGLADAVPGQHLLVADDDEAFSDAVVAVLEDSALGDRLAHEARALVERAYGWPVIARRWEVVLARVAAGQPAEAAA